MQLSSDIPWQNDKRVPCRGTDHDQWSKAAASRSYNIRHESRRSPAAAAQCRTPMPVPNLDAAARNKAQVTEQQYKTARSTPRRACPGLARAQESGARDSGRETRFCVSAGRMGGRAAIAIPTAIELPGPSRLVRLPGRVERRARRDGFACRSTLTCPRPPRPAAIADAGHSQSFAAKTRDSRVIRTAFRRVDLT